MTTADKIKLLEPYVSTHKQALINQVLNQRTRMITVVLEDIYQPQNASAVLRTCECFGIQDAYIIEKENNYEVNPKVVMGANKWLDLYYYSSSEGKTGKDCLLDLKKKGYKLYGTSPATEALEIQDILPDHKMAFIFGTELTGISSEVKELSDHLVKIPMKGFTESYNISVSVAIILQTLTLMIGKKTPEEYPLMEHEKEEITYRWYQSIVKNSDLILKRSS